MPFATALAERLRVFVDAPTRPDLGIAQWRLVVDTGTSTEVGLKDNQTGGPYDAPNQVTGTRGEIYVRWADGRVSNGTVDLTTLENLDEDLQLWRQAAFNDPHAPDVLGPQNVPKVALFVPQVADMVHSDHAPLFALLERMRAELPAYDVERVSGSVTVATNRRHLLTSAGLDHTSEGTSFGCYADADRRAYDYISLRGLPTEADVDRMLRRVGETNRQLRRDATLRPGLQDVLFTPSTTEAMLNKFLMANLDGQRVLNGGSAFTLAQFTGREAVFHPDFQFGVDPTQPLSPGSYELTREGVPARAFDFIVDGRLLTPLLDLKHALKAGLAPTPFPRGGSSLRLRKGPDVAPQFDELVAGMTHGLIVHQMLGLHTQDSVRGNYSITVAQGLVVEDGQVVGHTKSIISGNFLDALKQDFKFGTMPGKEVPGLLIRTEVTAG